MRVALGLKARTGRAVAYSPNREYRVLFRFLGPSEVLYYDVGGFDQPRRRLGQHDQDIGPSKTQQRRNDGSAQ